MKKLKLLLVAFAFTLLLGFNSINAANVVYSIELPLGILADNTEWECSTKPAGNNEPCIVSPHGSVVRGKSKVLPISFQFSYTTLPMDETHYIRILTDYAAKTSTVFSSVSFKKLIFPSLDFWSHGNPINLTEGAYFDNTSSGYFRIYYFSGYVMSMKIKGEFLDESCMESIFDNTLELITPLLSIKK